MSTIYIVDDHAVMRDGIKAILRAEGYTIVGESSDVTLSLAEMSARRPDLLLLDLSLGDRSGLEILDAIHARGLPIRTVVLTMSSHTRNVSEALRLGALSYVLKGEPTDELLRALKHASLGQTYIPLASASLVAKAIANRGQASALDKLSVRERQVISLVVRGYSSAQIGSQLHLSPKTVESYRSRLMAKLDVADITELVRLAVQAGLVEPLER